MRIGEWEVHPAADLFPMIGDDDLQRLADDIADHGLREAIVTWDGQVLDGRNRLRACLLRGTTPRFRALTSCGSPVGYVISLNLHRRHLSATQRAFMAEKALPMFKAEAERRQVEAGEYGKEGGRGNRKTLEAKIVGILEPSATMSMFNTLSTPTGSGFTLTPILSALSWQVP